MKIRVKGLTQWAKNRIRQHGDTFDIFAEDAGEVCVYSLRDTFQLKKGVFQKWCGWFVIGSEVEVLERIQ